MDILINIKNKIMESSQDSVLFVVLYFLLGIACSIFILLCFLMLSGTDFNVFFQEFTSIGILSLGFYLILNIAASVFMNMKKLTALAVANISSMIIIIMIALISSIMYAMQ